MESYLQKQLLNLLEERFDILSTQHLTVPSWQAISKSKYAEETIKVYQALGGQQKQPAIRLPEDSFILLNNKFVIFFDEVLHFNRYRALTFKSDIYQELPHIPRDLYKTYCRKNEKECLKSGLANNLWSFSFAEKHFGQASERGDFANNGSPSWKLRALEDFLLDVALLNQGVQVLRIAIYQQLMLNRQLHKVGDILMSGREAEKTALLNYIERKVSS